MDLQAPRPASGSLSALPGKTRDILTITILNFRVHDVYPALPFEATQHISLTLDQPPHRLRGVVIGDLGAVFVENAGLSSISHTRPTPINGRDTSAVCQVQPSC